MRKIRNPGLCLRSRAMCLGGLSLAAAAFMLPATAELVTLSRAQEPGKLTSRASADIDRADSTAPLAASPGDSASGAPTDQLMREGAKLVNQPVTCRGSGDRLLVELPQASLPLVALENLASQRILQAILDDTGSERWIINGSVTEFQGRNYILLDRVTRQPKG